jgi:hypothetical protein
LLNDGRKKTIITQGISPYFLTTEQITDLLLKELKPKLKDVAVGEINYYGTGCANPENARSVKKSIDYKSSRERRQRSHMTWWRQPGHCAERRKELPVSLAPVPIPVIMMAGKS